MSKVNWRLLGVVAAAAIVPSAGHVILGKAPRGLMLAFWMIALGFITYKLAGPEISFWGRYSGGFAVWVLSVLDAAHLARLRFSPAFGLAK
jgi:hypothetical protein